MKDFTKVVFPGTRKIDSKRADVFCKIELKNGCLSITGVEGPKANGNALGSCGQIDKILRETFTTNRFALASNWSEDTFIRFLDIWDRWHLNDMKAGTPEQQAELGKHVFPGYPTSHYSWACEILQQAPPFTVWCLPAITPEQDAKIWASALGNTRAPKIAKVRATPETFETIEAASLHAATIDKAKEPEIYGLWNDEGYKYGSAWLREEVPSDVLEFLAGLPDSEVTPAWV
jgi:hypothetical protein